MEIYIEYAFLENFVYDGGLLFLSLLATKTEIRWKKICFSAFIGGVFALLFPLLKLSGGLSVLLKISVGAVLCMLAFGRLKTKKQWGRYAFTTILFFCFSFGFGGTLLGIYTFSAEKVPTFLVFPAFSLLFFFSIWLIARLYAQKGRFRGIYSCIITVKGKKMRADGFYDSGNFVQKEGKPVCFISVDLLYEIIKAGGQVCGETQIRTLSGDKTVQLYEGELTLQGKTKGVYFALFGNRIEKNYKILLNHACIGEADETDRMA